MANQSVILSGVSIAGGAAVGANAVVTKDVPPYAVVAGNPARQIKQRFNAEQVEALLAVKWWDWETERIREFVPLLCSGRIDDFIEQARR